MRVDTSNWSGEGTFTQVLVDRLREVAEVVAVRVEDAPASRSDADYNFVSNEIYVIFATADRREPVKRLGFFPGTRTVKAKAMTVADLERTLTDSPEVGAPDYGDDTMLQYLKTERIVPPYQTRGYKLVEMVRIYEAREEVRSEK